MRTSALRLIAIAVTAIGFAACGGYGSSSPSSPSNSPQIETNTVTITSAGVNPANIVIAAGTRVTFVNNDNDDHNMNSDPHPDHTDCPALNVGEIPPGQSRESQPLTAIRTCGFHDHDNPNDASLRGRVTIR